MIKLFASDLDGTLLNYFHHADRVVRAAVREVVASGAHMVLATGRTSHSGASHGFGNLPLEIVGSNGAIIRDAHGTVLKSFVIDQALVEDLLRTFPMIVFECVAAEGSYITGSFDEWMAGFSGKNALSRAAMMRRNRKRAASDPTLVLSQTVDQVLEHDICKLNCRTRDEGLKRELSAYLADHADTLVNEPFQPVMFEISSAGVNKGAALAWLAAHLGIAEDEVAVYGDGGNDIQMLERFAHAYAPSNANAAAKRAAGTVIGSNVAYAVPRHMVRTVRAQQGRYVVE